MLTSQHAVPDPNPLYDPQRQWLRLREAIAPEDQAPLEDAFRLALHVHARQWRKTAAGAPRVPYTVHPIRVARIMAEEWNRKQFPALALALLHDILEDCAAEEQQKNSDEIERIAGPEVCEAVWTLTRPRLPEPVPEETKNRRDADYFHAVRSAPEWVRLVKCADRVDNLRDARVWGELEFWERYSSQTIGWHLFLARETAPIAEVALFKALVEGERALHGQVPLWADGHLIDPTAARMIPEHVARLYGAIGLALQGDVLIIGLSRSDTPQTLTNIRLTLRTNGKHIEEIRSLSISEEALQDALNAGLYGRLA